MVRPRKSTTARARKTNQKTAAKARAGRVFRERESTSSKAGSFVCPECGRTFSRAAALGAHRSRAHGVAGRSASARAKRAQQKPSAGGWRRRGLKQSTGGVDRDQLLRSLFPAGVPPREEVIRAINAWLEAAERLAPRRQAPHPGQMLMPVMTSHERAREALARDGRGPAAEHPAQMPQQILPPASSCRVCVRPLGSLETG